MRTREFNSMKLIKALFLVIIFSLFLPGNILPAQQIKSPNSQVDPFYLRLFDEGQQAFRRGEMEEALEDFKLAAFGFLDAPDLLGKTLVYLTVTAYNLKKNDLVEHYLKEITRLKLNKKILDSNLPSELKEQFAKIQSTFNGLNG
ncbi:MAG: hypothetical protein ACPLZD_05790 [Candidatus Saccharicenans sp.]|nr:MAG: hypothetical protein C0168_00435 [Candidatus Aminicenantes bacterium]HEK86603.1 hypothetical protein [Candidatus Aminicenantes bacterium]